MRAHAKSRFSHYPAILAAAVVAAGCAGHAEAGKRHPAPIVYKTEAPAAAISPERETVYIAPEQGSRNESKARARIEFRYPGQSDELYGGADTRQAVAEAPKQAPRQYASISPPQAAYPAPATQQVLTPGSFDARAAAAEVARQQEERAIQSEALPALELPAVTKGQGSVRGAPARLTPAVAHEVVPDPVPVFDETVLAIVYGDEFENLPTANGELFSQQEYTAAHPTLPLPSLVQVVNETTGAEIVVRVNDRGPFEEGASLQLSKSAAGALGMSGAGRANVRVRYLGPAPARARQETPAPQMADLDGFNDVPELPQKPVQVAYNAPAYVPVAQPVRQSVYQPPVMGSYFVQLASFADIGNAQRMRQALPADMTTVIVPARVNGGDYFRVRVGPFMTRDAADQVRNDLRDRGIADGRVVTGN